MLYFYYGAIVYAVSMMCARGWESKYIFICQCLLVSQLEMELLCSITLCACILLEFQRAGRKYDGVEKLYAVFYRVVVDFRFTFAKIFCYVRYHY